MLPAEGVSSPDDDGEAYLLDHPQGVLQRGRGGRLGALLADGRHAAGEELSVLGRDDGFNRGAEHPHA